MVVAVGIPSLDTEVSVIDLREGCTANSGDAAVGDLDIKLTSNAAVTAGGLYDRIGWMPADAIDVCDRTRRTVVHARAAGYAGTIRKMLGRTKDEVRGRAAAFDSVNELPLNFIASMKASSTIDAE